MNNPYRMLENWPHLGDIKPGAAIGIVPDGKGGVWLQHRSEPAILHIDPSGNIVKQFDVTFSSSHGFCQDQDGNFWAADSGPFNDTPDAGVKGNQVFKFDQNGKLLLTLGKAGVSQGRAPTRSCSRRPAARRRTATSSSPTATGRGRRRPSRTATAWSGSRATESSSRSSAGTGASRANSWVRTVSRSTRRAGCSSPIARTTASRSSTRT